ncbi:CRISPR type I-E-associated protein CasB/Cse2 [Spinactinospora alkalitolerans]|uniref:CRISPR type I-E-associated protein CasB/Cse2 n=1 Tax=Spinactinospora alkalitolerans TaxID=687207 RepID=A0A852U1G7_9ACTN|nr:type I-E CRISPR-associated protein Cse2/CasB [Spinactinospora alkalitolerans]NYE50068.1 CRISPR type I-E-associated protein CasB/Cse2 [Spinactinospora alkalitolerans]
MSAPPSTRDKRRAKIRERATSLVADVRGILDKPGPRAELRRAVGMEPGNPRCWHAHRHVEPHLPGDRDEATERAFLAVAALIAAQPPAARGQERGRGVESEEPDSTQVPGEPASPFTGNLGVVLAHAVDRRAIGDTAAEGRLHLLCRQDTAGVHRQLPRLVFQLRNSRVHVDWVQLACDLSEWENDRDRVVKNWLQGYHRTLHRLKAQRDRK